MTLISIDRNINCAGESHTDQPWTRSQLGSSFHYVSDALTVSVSPKSGETERCVHCESDDIGKWETTGKDAQEYWYKYCETYFNDLTNTLFGQHRFGLEEMFYITEEMQSELTA